MTYIIDSKSKRRLSAKLAAGLAISAFLVLGTFVASASAQERHDDRGGWDHRGEHNSWNGGYYSAPPVVYGTPYVYGAPYYAPPVVYGPSIGIGLPGINIGIQ